jgi:hypothetical protein
MQQRFAHRKVCATLFEEFIFQTEVSTDPSAPDSRHRQLDQQNAVERWKWLDRFEREIILDRVAISPDQLAKALTDTSLELSRRLER